MSQLCCRLKPGIRSPVLKCAILHLSACLVLPIVHGSLTSPRGWLDSASERLNIFSAESGSEKKSLAEEPAHLSLGTRLYLIHDHVGGRAGGGPCLGRRKRIEEDYDPFGERAPFQRRTSEPHSTNHENNIHRTIQGYTDSVRQKKFRETAKMERSRELYDRLPGPIVSYFTSYKQPQNQLPTQTSNQVLGSHMISTETTPADVRTVESRIWNSGMFFETNYMYDIPYPQDKMKIMHDSMSGYHSFRREHLFHPSQDANMRRPERIMQANEFLGAQEISCLDLHVKEVELARYLLELGFSGRFPGWRPTSIFSAVLKSIRCIRITLCRIRMIGEMCDPPLYKSLEVQKDDQKDAYELLSNFWARHIFPAISNGDERLKIDQTKPGSLEELMTKALCAIEKRAGQSAGGSLVLSWIVFEYWFRKRMPTISAELYHKLKGIYTSKGGVIEGIDQDLKLYLSDKAIVEALQAKQIEPDYHIEYTATFKLRRAPE